MKVSANKRTTSKFSKRLAGFLGVALAISLLFCSGASAETPYETLWLKQMGSKIYDHATGVVTDATGNVFVTGWHGSLVNDLGTEGSGDIFLGKFSAGGEALWMKPLGDSNACDVDVAVDGAGNVFVTGYTYGALVAGQANAGSADIFLVKFSAAGETLWVKLLGSPSGDIVEDVAVDSAGNVFVTGYTYGALVAGQANAGSADIFLVKFSAAGETLWVKQFGSIMFDIARGVTVDTAGNVFVTGGTEGALVAGQANAGGDDLFLAKFSAVGESLWLKQVGSATYDHAYGVVVDAFGNLFVAGMTHGVLATGLVNVGGSDLFLAKFSATGEVLGLRQVGSEGDDYVTDVAVDAAGNALVTGYTYGVLEDGQSNSGGNDFFFAKFNNAGEAMWFKQVGSAMSDEANGLSVDSAGNVFVTGRTSGALVVGQANAGSFDFFIVKFGAALVISPAQISFGDIGIGEHGTGIVTASNVGQTARQITAMNFLVGSNPDFTAVSIPLPAVIQPGATLDVPLIYSPTLPGPAVATLRIASNDPHRPEILVELSGTGIVVVEPPGEQIDEILSDFDADVAAGTITGSGNGNSQEGRKKALRNMLRAVDNLIADGNMAGACQQLNDVYLRMDGSTPPPDFIQGQAVAVIAAKIVTLKQGLACP